MDMLKQEIENEKKKQSKSKRIVESVPDVLLGYTYFLNDIHTCHLTIGYDTDDFTMKIILYKNNVYEILYWSEWNLLYNNMVVIKTHFEDKMNGIDFMELPKINHSRCAIKLTTRNFERGLLFLQDGKKRLLLNDKEWEKLYSLLPYMHSIVNWYMLSSKEIFQFYKQYMSACVEKNTLRLNSHELMLSNTLNFNYCNFSRLFSEIPILCKQKLINDVYEYLCGGTSHSSSHSATT